MAHRNVTFNALGHEMQVKETEEIKEQKREEWEEEREEEEGERGPLQQCEFHINVE